MQSIPKPPLKWLFSLTDSAPGFKLFRLCTMFFVSDVQALRARMSELFAEDAPSIVVPGHGPAVTDDVSAATKAQLARL